MGIVSASYTISDLSDGANVFFLNTTRSAEQAILEAWGSNGGGNWLFTEITSDYSAVVPGDTCWMRCTNTSKDGYTYVGMVVSSVSATALVPASGCGIIDKGDIGISITNVVEHYLAYTSDSGVTTSTSGWDIDITLDFTKKYLWNYETINYSDNTHTDTTPRVVGYYKDKGISTIVEKYALSTTATKPADSAFIPFDPTIHILTPTNKYLWNYSIITYTDNSTTGGYSTALIIGTYGDKGDRGISFTGINEHYLASSEASGVTTSTAGWDTVTELTATLKYLWNYETINYSEGSPVNTTPRIVGYYKDKGISSIVEYYALSTTTTKPASSSFTPTMKTIDATNKYLWNYTLITYTDDSTSGGYANAVIIGVYGDKGDSPTARPQYALLYEDDQPSAQTEWSDEVPSGWVMGYSYWTRTQYEYPDGSFEYSDPIRDTVYNQYMMSQAYLRIVTDKTMYAKNLRDPNLVEITVSPVVSGYENPTYSWNINGITYSTTSVTVRYRHVDLPDIIDVTCNMSSTVNNVVYSASANLKIYITDNTRYNVNFDIQDADPVDSDHNFVDGDFYTKHTTSGGIDNYIPYIYNNGSWIEITNVSLYPEQISQIRDTILSKGINVPISSEAIYGFFKNASIQNAQIDTLSTSEITLQDGGSIQSDNYQTDGSGNPLSGFKIDSTGKSVFVNSIVKDSIVSGSFTSNALETQEESPGVTTSGVWENVNYYCDKDAYTIISQHTTPNAITSVNGTFGSESFTEILDIKSNEERQKLRTLSSSSNIETTTSINATIPLNSTVKVNGSTFERKIDTFYYHTNRISTTEYSLNNTDWTSFSNQVSINATYGQTVYARQTINIPNQLEVGDLNTVKNLANSPFSLPNSVVLYEYTPDNFIQVGDVIIINSVYRQGGLFRSADYGNSWQQLNISGYPGDPAGLIIAANKNGTVVALGMTYDSTTYEPTFWAFWSDDTGLTWHQASTPAVSELGTRWPSFLKVGDNGEFRGFAYYNKGYYWKSTDNGRTWQAVADSRFSGDGGHYYQLYGNGRWVDFISGVTPMSGTSYDRLSFTNGMFIYITGRPIKIYTSTDGSNWTLVNSTDLYGYDECWQSNIFYSNGYYYALFSIGSSSCKLYRTNNLATSINSWEILPGVGGFIPAAAGVADDRALDNIHYIGGTLVISHVLLAAYQDETATEVGFITYGRFTPSDWKTVNKGSLSISYDYQNYNIGANLLKTTSSPKARTLVGLIENVVSWKTNKTTISSWSLNPQNYVKFNSFRQNNVAINSFDYKKYVDQTTFTIRFQTYGNSAINITSSGQSGHYYNLKWNGSTFNIILNGAIQGLFDSSQYFIPGAVITFTPFGTMDAIIVKEILPRLDSQYGIGAQGNEFATAYINNMYGNLTGNLTGNVTGNLTGTVTGNLIGNADTATTATTATNANRDRNGISLTVPSYGTQGSTGYIKININSETSWMTRFTVRLYQGYVGYDIAFQGYNYGSNHWYSPTAELIAGTGSITVYFGYDANWKLWVAIPGGNYTGLKILDVVNGYTQVTDFADKFQISVVSSLSGTTQSTQTIYKTACWS